MAREKCTLQSFSPVPQNRVERVDLELKAQFSHSVVSDSLRPHGLQHARSPCPSPTHRACSNSCPLSRWCHPTISSSVVPFSSCPQFFPASGSLPMSQFFASGGQSVGASASASVLPMNIQEWIWANSRRQLRTGEPAVHGVAKSWTWLSDWATTTNFNRGFLLQEHACKPPRWMSAQLSLLVAV